MILLIVRGGGGATTTSAREIDEFRPTNRVNCGWESLLRRYYANANTNANANARARVLVCMSVLEESQVHGYFIRMAKFFYVMSRSIVLY